MRRGAPRRRPRPQEHAPAGGAPGRQRRARHVAGGRHPAHLARAADRRSTTPSAPLPGTSAGATTNAEGLRPPTPRDPVLASGTAHSRPLRTTPSGGEDKGRDDGAKGDRHDARRRRRHRSPRGAARQRLRAAPALQVPRHPAAARVPGHRRAHDDHALLPLLRGGGGHAAAAALLPHVLPFFLYLLVVSNAIGAFSAFIGGLSDKIGRANLTIYGTLVVALVQLFAIPHIHDKWWFAASYCVIGFVEGVILVSTPALMRDFSPQMGRGVAMGFWALGPDHGRAVRQRGGDAHAGPPRRRGRTSSSSRASCAWAWWSSRSSSCASSPRSCATSSW